MNYPKAILFTSLLAAFSANGQENEHIWNMPEPTADESAGHISQRTPIKNEGKASPSAQTGGAATFSFGGPFNPYASCGSSCPTSDYGASGFTWGGENFEGFSHNDTVSAHWFTACGFAANPYHLETTSHCILAKHVNGSQTWKRGWIERDTFRSLARKTVGGNRVRWEDSCVKARFYAKSWMPGSVGDNHKGVNLFIRYNTEDDLYVGAFKKNGKLWIKKKSNNQYTALTSEYQHSQAPSGLPLNTWIYLELCAEGDSIEVCVKVNGVTECTSATDNEFPSGTAGIRTDYVETYTDDWSMFAP